ncbi:MAG: two-component system, NarL family, response regulator DesR [Acidimicrobiaceae bacterium]|jgi:DNA-binding NarL/FixJ family response regulator
MVVDDHGDMLASIASVLAHEGFRVVEAVAAGRDAVAGLKTHRPDFAGVDVRLGGITGSEVAREATRPGLDTASVILTGEAPPGLVQEALDSGAGVVVRKSVPPSSLLAAIATAVHGGIYVDPAFPVPTVGKRG